MATKTINQRITVTGGDEIARSLQELARLGEATFKTIADAAAKIDINLPIDKVKQQLQDLARSGQQAFQQLGQSAQQAGQQMANVGTAGAQSVQRLGESANQASSSVSGLSTTFKVVAGTIGGLTAAVGGLAAAWTAMAKSSSEAVLEIGRSADKAGASIEQFTRARLLLTQLGLSSSQAEQAIKRLGEVTKGSFDQALSALEQGGVRFNRFALQSEEARAKFIESIRGMANATVNGKAIFDDATRAVLQFNEAFRTAAAQGRPVTQAFVELADALSRIQNPAQQAKAITALFGEDLAKVLLPALRRGTAEFVNALGQIDRLRLGLTGGREEAQNFMRAWQLLQEVLKANNREIGQLFAEPLTPFVERFAEAMRRSAETFKVFEAAVKAVQPILDDLLKLIEGRRGEVKLQWVEEAAKQIENLGTIALQVFRGVIIPAFTALQKVATDVATAISEFFGGKVTPAVVAFGAAIALLIGPIGSLSLAIAALFAGEGPQFDKFREGLKEFGIDIDAIKAKIGEVVEEIKKIFRGEASPETQEAIKSIKNALVEFGTSVPGVIAEVTALFALLVRIVGPGRLATLMVANFTGVLDIFTKAVTIVALAFVGLNATLSILVTIAAAVGTSLGGLLIVIGAIGAAVLLVVTNIDKLLAAFAGIQALLAGDLGRAEAAFKLMGVAAQQAAAGVAQLRADLEKNPDMSGWEKAFSFVLGFVRKEIELALRELGNIPNEIAQIFGRARELLTPLMVAVREGIDAIAKAITQPFTDAFDTIRGQFDAMVEFIKTKIAEVLAALAQLNPFRRGRDLARDAGIDDIGRVEDRRDDVPLDQPQRFADLGGRDVDFEQMRTSAEEAFAAIRAAAETTVAEVTALFQGMAGAIAGSLSGLAEIVAAPFLSLGATIGGALAGIDALVASTFSAIQSGVANAASAVDAAIAQIISALEAAVARVQELARAAAEAAAAASAASGGSNGGSGFARGGYTGSISPRRVAGVVHGGEYVEPAHVVRRPGVRAFLETLRRVGDLREAFRRFSIGFSAGGFVDNLTDRMSAALVPGFANGGMVPAVAPTGGSRRDLGTLRIVGGGQTFEVLTDEATAVKLMRFGARSQMTSGGPTPVWARK